MGGACVTHPGAATAKPIAPAASTIRAIARDTPPRRRRSAAARHEYLTVVARRAREAGLPATSDRRPDLHADGRAERERRRRDRGPLSDDGDPRLAVAAGAELDRL